MKRKVRVRFEPDGVEVTVDRGDNLLRTVMAAGVFLNVTCGKCGFF